ncbi:YraN family protein [Endomicrobium proavitum]|uniref:UPF0102 protein Epro_1194 n=1 Tax=Endomicrobium proavitum TaxID=1408281 RepID=A0A0G3WJV0_9BACT|nr:YraN family protein [Endomicrobium proavitum]AKL98573.1 hypothetical protein Epro_1194 [Endomicrobium proavitum]
MSRDIGFAKEKEVADFLKKRGYKILETNFLTRFGEIDIIAKHKKTIVFIEVKYRSSLYAGAPQEAVTSSKQKKIIKAAIMYIKLHNINSDLRFDVAAVDDKSINIIESSFEAPENSYYL